MDAAIIGLPRSGKTAVFNAVTRGAAQVAGYGGQAEPNIGVAKVLDPRLRTLESVFMPKRVVPAEVAYIDLPPPPEGFGKTRGISGQYLNHLQRADVLVIVVRAFEDPAVPHIDDSIDPLRDADTMLLELAFADLEIIERRLARLAVSLKGASASERESADKEQALLARVQEHLEAGQRLRGVSLNKDGAKLLDGFGLLTAKPVVLVVNIGEEQLDAAAEIATRLDRPMAEVAALCGALEMDLAQMDPADEAEMREGLDAGESGLQRMIALSHKAADLVTFFTGNHNEVHAWTVPRGTEAAGAAGRVHSDFERGFIRAEVIAIDDLEQCGTIAEARRRGLLRQEGRAYQVQEGDVINILFNV